MKIDFILQRLGLSALLLACPLSMIASTAQAQGIVARTPQEVLADFFQKSQVVTYQKVPIDAAAGDRLRRRLGYVPSRPSYTFYVARTGGRVDGYALIDEEKGEHLPITFAVKLSPAGVVERQEILAYREPRGDEVRDPRFRGQFVGKTVRDPVEAERDIAVISGATISSRSMALGVRRALVIFDELVRPTSVATAPVSASATARQAPRTL